MNASFRNITPNSSTNGGLVTCFNLFQLFPMFTLDKVPVIVFCFQLPQYISCYFIQNATFNLIFSQSNSLNLKKFNIVAGQPKTDAALTVSSIFSDFNLYIYLSLQAILFSFQHCCTTFNGDIVTFDAHAGGRLYVNRKAYQVAVKRGIFFEIKYSPLISDSNFRKDIIKVAHNYLVRGKSKSIVISSGATNPFELRGPYDVANL